jgi:glutathione S-transferase
MRPTITAFKASPDRGRGLARDMAVRWALEEVGQPYDTRLVTFAEMKAPAHLALQPFGQIPTYQEGDLVLFESGAIVLHVAERHPGVLLPVEPDARARAVAWIFAALATMQPPIVEFGMAALVERDKPWFEARQPLLEQAVRARLDPLAARLGEADWLDGPFTAGDLVMVTVLRRLGSSGVLDNYPRLSAYIARAEARPAFQRAFADQRAVFEAASAAE